MEGSGVISEIDLPPICALPDAPLPMPKQVLERRRSLFTALRWALLRMPMRS